MRNKKEATMKTRIRVGLIGYGRAGKAVARVLAKSDDIDLRWIAKQKPAEEIEQAGAPAPILSAALLPTGELFEREPVDALVDFSTAAAVRKYGKQAAARHVAIISAVSKYPPTTKALLERLAKETVVMSSPNITLGINYLLVAAELLQFIAPFTDIEIIEEHFRDKPERSGTALRIAQTLGLDESKVNSIRVGGIVGRHEVVFGFPFQTVRLCHDSISCEAFGTGALFALRKLHGRAPGFYAYENILRDAMIESLLAKGAQTQ
jgi:4-hydroxy-tetrahydrodipicolinate reductase